MNLAEVEAIDLIGGLVDADAFCRRRGIRHIVVPTDEFEQEEVRRPVPSEIRGQGSGA